VGKGVEIEMGSRPLIYVGGVFFFSWGRGVFNTRFYKDNHARRLRLEKLLYLEPSIEVPTPAGILNHF
jgi:hypothetical protein